jgi:ATP-binding cassette, subfamily B, multidrug efflux pump
VSVPDNKVLPGHPFRMLLRYNLPYKWEYLGGMGLALIFLFIELTMPMVFKVTIDKFTTGAMTCGLLWAAFAGLVAIGLGSGIARYWQRSLMIRASRKFEYDLRNDYFRRLQALSQDFFHRVKTGDIMARATSDMDHVRMFIGRGLIGFVDMLRIPFTLALMMYFSLRLTGIALLPLPFVSVMVYFFVTFMHRQSAKVQAQFSVVNSRVQENLAGARVVKAYGIADRELEVFLDASRKYMRENIKLAAVTSLAWPLIGSVIGLSTLLILWLGGAMVIDGHLTLGSLSGFMVCLFMVTFPLAQFGWTLTLYQRAAVSMNRIAQIMSERPTVHEHEQPVSVETVQGVVRFEEVSFSYNGRPVLKGLSFDIEEGQTTAVVGPTGSGKSSIVSLIVREHDPASGRVLVDNIDVRRWPLRKLRGSIGYVPQDTFLFSDTIRANLVFGRPDAAQNEIDSACEIAQFAETVSRLPDGYETLLGERGVNLSGGQKQRLAIARAVIRNPRILILDDALSSVDTHTEEEILTRLKDVMAERTSILISHRVSAVRHATQILVVAGGEIVERGRHAELVALGGLYADIYQRQLLEQELEQEL